MVHCFILFPFLLLIVGNANYIQSTRQSTAKPAGFVFGFLVLFQLETHPSNINF